MKDILSELPNPAEFNMFNPNNLTPDQTYGDLYSSSSSSQFDIDRQMGKSGVASSMLDLEDYGGVDFKFEDKEISELERKMAAGIISRSEFEEAK